MTENVKPGSYPVCEEFTNISLEDDGKKKKKQPRRILHFSDGILEEYSTDEEEEKPQEPVVDPRRLTWMPWVWYYVVTVSKKALSVADTCGEHLAWFFGITSPKYQYAIDEYYRMKEEEEREQEAEEKRQKRLQEEKLSHVEVDKNIDVNEQVTEQNSKEDSDIKICDNTTEGPSIHREKY